MQDELNTTARICQILLGWQDNGDTWITEVGLTVAKHSFRPLLHAEDSLRLQCTLRIRMGISEYGVHVRAYAGTDEVAHFEPGDPTPANIRKAVFEVARSACNIVDKTVSKG